VVLALAAVAYAGVFAAFVLLEKPGLGVGHFFYVPICLVALVTDGAIGTSLPSEQIVALGGRVNRSVAQEGFSVTFGSTFCPADGQTATELFHKADDRLFAAKLIHRNRATVVALATASGS